MPGLLPRRFEAAFERIAENPGIGHRRKELRDQSVRVLEVSGYLVIYDAELSPIHILRVVRAARDLSRVKPRQ
jgi:plasmid stabilization system protein ParE